MTVNGRLYDEWSDKLEQLNTWLLDCRKMVDGYEAIDMERLKPSSQVHSIIKQMTATMNGYFDNDVPLQLSQLIYTRTLESNLSTEPLDKFLALDNISTNDFPSELINLLHVIITSLDTMVNYWYPLKRRR